MFRFLAPAFVATAVLVAPISTTVAQAESLADAMAMAYKNSNLLDKHHD